MNAAIAGTSAHRRVGSLALALAAAVGWFFLALLELLVKLALFPAHRSYGATAVLWGLGFGVFLWLGSLSVGLDQWRALLLGLVAGAASALFVYLRGASREEPPAARPGEHFRRLRSRRQVREASPRPGADPREIHRARVALTDFDYAGALYFLREAERVAVAQRKLDELLEVRRLVSTLPQTPASERLARIVDEAVNDFPPGELASAGIHVRTDEELVESLRHVAGRAGDHLREASLARRALDKGEFAEALFWLQEARQIAVAQRKLGGLLEVHELVQPLAARSSGQTRAAAEELERKVMAGLRTWT
jgi:hypothetical protein